jgi:hypothetical protein
MYAPKSYLNEFFENELVYLVLLKFVKQSGQTYSANDFQVKEAEFLNNPHNLVRTIIGKKYSTEMEQCLFSFSRNGSFLENLGLASIVRASILGPFSGQRFDQFFLALCKQLSLVPIDNATFDSLVLGSTAEFIVPFLAPVNAYFSSSFRSIEGVYPGTVVSTKNETEIDGFVLPFDMMSKELEDLARSKISKEDSSLLEKRNLPTTLHDGFGKEVGGLMITTEMKNYEENVDWATLKPVFKKVINFRNNFMQSDRRLKKHVHFVFLSKKANWNYLIPDSVFQTWRTEEMVKLLSKAKKNKPRSAKARACNPSKKAKTEEPGKLAAAKAVQAESKNAPFSEFSCCRFFVASFDKIRCEVCLEKYVLFSEEEEKRKLEQEIKDEEAGKKKAESTDEAESTDALIDIIILPIENMFVHTLR